MDLFYKTILAARYHFGAQILSGSKNDLKDNKFGFDRVILVCDIQNIRNIFKHRYEADVDFNGYIDKFYSTDIFHFQNYRQLNKVTGTLLHRMNISDFRESAPFYVFINKFDHGFANIITGLVYHNIVSLRQVLNFTSAAQYFPNLVVRFEKFNIEINEGTPILEMILLSKLMGGYHGLVLALNKLMLSSYQVKNVKLYYNKLTYFDLRYFHDFGGIKSTLTRKINGELYELELISSKFAFQNMKIYKKDNENGSLKTQFDPRPEDFFSLYIKILSELHNEKLLE
jgi:hypothetical protein